MPASLSRRGLLGGVGGLAAATGLAACSGNSSNSGSGSSAGAATGTASGAIDGNSEVTVYAWSNGPTIDANFKKRVDLFNEAFKGKYTAKINFLPYDQYWQKIQLQYAANQPFDIYYWDVQAYAHYKKQLLEDLQPVIDQTPLGDASKYPTKLFDPYRFDGKDMYVVPDNIQSLSFFYNKDHFDAAGIAVPDSTWTWDKVLEAAQKLQKQTGGKTTRWGVDIGAYGSWWGAQTLSWSAGTAWVDKPLEPTKFLMDDQRNIDSLQFLQDLMWSKHIAPRPEERNAMNTNGGGFASGAVSMAPGGTWDIAGFKGLKFKWGMTSLPAWKGTSVSPYFLGCWVIPKASKAKSAAHAFATWSATDFQATMAKDHDWIPVQTAARESSDMTAGMPSGYADAMKSIGDAKIGNIFTTNMQQIFNQVFGPNLDDLFNNRATGAQVAKKIQDGATALL